MDDSEQGTAPDRLPGLARPALSRQAGLLKSAAPRQAGSLLRPPEDGAKSVLGRIDGIDAHLLISGNLDPVSLHSFPGKVLEGALSMLHADLGNIQIADPATGALRIAAQCGFGPGVPRVLRRRRFGLRPGVAAGRPGSGSRRHR